MEKVKVSKDVFEALEELRRMNGDLRKDIVKYIDKYTADRWIKEELKPLNVIDLEKFMECVFYGYELEDTPEEKLLSVFNKHETYNSYNYGFKCGVITTLDILGIKIKGIN